jgi:hypothetical protein
VMLCCVVSQNQARGAHPRARQGGGCPEKREGRHHPRKKNPPTFASKRGTLCTCERRGSVSGVQKQIGKPKKEKKKKHRVFSVGCGMAHPRMRHEVTSRCVASQNQAGKGVSQSEVREGGTS